MTICTDKPDKQITRYHRRQCERNAYLHKISDADLISLLAKYSKSAMFRGGAYRREISAESRAGNQAEVLIMSDQP
jgi:hypothetical protein